MASLSLTSFQNRMIARNLRRGRITPEMARNRREMAAELRPYGRVQLVLAVIMLAVFAGLLARIIGVWAMQPLLALQLINIPLMGLMFVKFIHYSKVEKRLRRDASLDGHLTP